MNARLRILIPARNEQARLGALLASVSRGLSLAEALGARWQSEVLVVLDRCTDDTAKVAARAGARVIVCPQPGGKVEALRAGMRADVDFHVCVDADVVLGARTLFDLVQTLADDQSALAACPPLCPASPSGWPTPLSWALHRYNAARGYSSERLWLSGRCYAVRYVAFPTPTEMQTRALHLGSGTLPEASAALIADDVWLSRALLVQDTRAIRHVTTDPVSYRAPDSLRGMSRTYRRLRRELRRIDLLFPELPSPGRDRRVDRLQGGRDRLAYGVFQLALVLCKGHAYLEEQVHALLASSPDPWPVVSESKR